MSDLLFATPWWLLGCLIFVGGVLFWSGNNRQQKEPKIAGIALVVLAIILKTLSFLVETDKEIATRHTRELIAAVQARDWTKFGSLMDDDVRLSTSVGTVFANKDVLVNGAKSDMDSYTPTNVTASISGVEQDSSGIITVDIDASSEQPITMGMRAPSSWKLLWDRSGKDWHLHEIICLKIANENPAQFSGWLKH